MAFSGTQKTRQGASALPRSLYSSFAGKSAGAANVLISQYKGVMRGIHSRIFGRMN